MGDSAQCTVVLFGAVNEAVVEQVVAALAALPAEGVLLIDASQASRLEAALLGRLVRAIREHCGRATVRIRGLCRQDYRLLGYLGLELEDSVAAIHGRRAEARAEAPPDGEFLPHAHHA